MARKKKAKKAAQEASVPMESMIDVVFLLLIYFIVTQKPIIEDTLLGVNLPSGKSSPSSEPSALFTVGVTRLGAESINYYMVNGIPTKFSQLSKQLEDIAKNDPDTTIIIKCGPNAKHEKLIKILDACAEHGLKKLNLVEMPIAYTPE